MKEVSQLLLSYLKICNTKCWWFSYNKLDDRVLEEVRTELSS